MPPIELQNIRVMLQDQTNLGLSGEYEEVDGGLFATLRPVSLNRPYGFSMHLSRVSRQVEASLYPDRQAGWLLKTMRTASDTDKEVFLAIVESALVSGCMVNFLVNGQSIHNIADFPEHHWDEVILECSARLSDPRARTSEVNKQLVLCGFTCLTLVLSLLHDSIEEIAIPNQVGLPEGAMTRVEVNKYERNPANRVACIALHGFACSACGMVFEHRYGSIGKGFIHVHHITPVSQLTNDYEINPATDLVPLCPNCHAMAHRTNPPLSIDRIRLAIGEVAETCNVEKP